MAVRTLIILAGVLVLAAPAATESFRCGQWIVSEDVSVAELLQRCGEPTSKTSETIDVYGPSASGGGRVKRGTTTVEKWTYDRGSLARVHERTFDPRSRVAQHADFGSG